MHLSTQATLTWNGLKAGLMFWTSVWDKTTWSSNLLAACTVREMWITCRWLSLFAFNHLEIHHSYATLHWDGWLVGSFLWGSWSMFASKHGDCIPEHVRSGNKAIQSCSIQLLILKKVMNVCFLTGSIYHKLMNSAFGKWTSCLRVLGTYSHEYIHGK